MTDDLNPTEQLAFPFLRMAVGLDAALQNPEDRETLEQMVEDNAALWLYFKDEELPKIPDVPADTVDFVTRVCDFMVGVMDEIPRGLDDGLLGRLVQINLNMSEVVLQTAKVAPPEG